jgi:hypothetical protein
MGRRKGSLNKKTDKVQVDEKYEVVMSETAVIADEEVLESIQKELDIARNELERTKMEIEEKKKELAYSPKREIDEAERKIVDRQVKAINLKSAAEETIAQQKEYDNVMVTGKFINRRAPGQSVKLPYQKYADDPVKWYVFEDGKVYTIKRGFADQINQYYHTPIFQQKQGIQSHSNVVGENSAIAEVDTSNKKYAFVPVAF